VKVGGLVTGLRVVLTKANAQEMAFVKIEDDSGSVEAVVFPKVYTRTKQCWGKDRVVLIKGRLQEREDTQNLVVDEAWLLEKGDLAENQGVEEKPIDWDFEVNIPSQLSPNKLVGINKILKENQGKDRVALAFVDHQGRVKRMILPFGVEFSQELEKAIKQIIEE